MIKSIYQPVGKEKNCLPAGMSLDHLYDNHQTSDITWSTFDQPIGEHLDHHHSELCNNIQHTIISPTPLSYCCCSKSIHFSMAILANRTAAASWSKLAEIWPWLVAGSAHCLATVVTRTLFWPDECWKKVINWRHPNCPCGIPSLCWLDTSRKKHIDVEVSREQTFQAVVPPMPISCGRSLTTKNTTLFSNSHYQILVGPFCSWKHMDHKPHIISTAVNTGE